MSRILNRPMFRGGGKVSSYGKGIASGLTSKPKRGLVDEPGGYAGEGQTLGADLLRNTQGNLIRDAQGLTIPRGNFGNDLTYLVSPLNKLKLGLGTAKGIYGLGTKYAGLPSASTVAGKTKDFFTKYPLSSSKELSSTPGLGKASLGSDRYLKELLGPAIANTKAGFKNLVGGVPKLKDYKTAIGVGGAGGTYGLVKAYDSFKERQKGTQGKEEQSPTGIVPPGGGDPNMYAEKVVDSNGVPELTVKEQVNKDKALFAELLGGDKAKGKDVSDMLLRFAGSGGNTVGEKFQQYIGNEAQAGPSRTEKINQAAASLAINDYIAGKRSKESMEMMIEKTRFGVDYTLDAREAREDISKMSFSDGLDRMVEVMGGKKMRNDPAVIKNVLSIQMPGQQINIKTFANKTLSEVASKDADKFEIGLNIVSYKGGKIILERIGKTMTEVPNLSIT